MSLRSSVNNEVHFRISNSLLILLTCKYNLSLLLNTAHSQHGIGNSRRGVQTKYKNHLFTQVEVTFTHPRLALAIDLTMVIEIVAIPLPSHITCYHSIAIAAPDP